MLQRSYDLLPLQIHDPIRSGLYRWMLIDNDDCGPPIYQSPQGRHHQAHVFWMIAAGRIVDKHPSAPGDPRRFKRQPQPQPLPSLQPLHLPSQEQIAEAAADCSL